MLLEQDRSHISQSNKQVQKTSKENKQGSVAATMAALQQHAARNATTASSAAAAAVTQLEFHQAMSDFKTMFPAVDADVIECVLRANNGAVDSTIDQLLQMAADLDAAAAAAPAYAAASSTAQPQAILTHKPVHPRNQLISLDDDVDAGSPSSLTTGQTPPPSYHQAVPSDVGLAIDEPLAVAAAAASSSSQTLGAKSRVKNCNLLTAASMTSGSLAATTSAPSNGASAAMGTSVCGDSSRILTQKVSNQSLRARFKWNPPMLGPLPDSFMRFPDAGHRSAVHHPLATHVAGRSSSAGRARSHSDRVTGGARPNVLSTSLLQQVCRRRCPCSLTQSLSLASPQKMHENELKRQQASLDDPEAAQFLDDERLAILLQNEEFVRELRNNKEFMSQLQRDAAAGAHHHSRSSRDDRDGASGGAMSNFSDAAFKEMLKNMSKVSRKKFAQVAGMFSRRKRGRSEGSGGMSGGVSGSGTGSGSVSSPSRHMSRDLLLGPSAGRDDEYRELENDSSDSEPDRSRSPYWERPTTAATGHPGSVLTRDPNPDQYFVGYRSPDRASSSRDKSSGFRL